MNELSKIPGVDTLLNKPEIKKLADSYNRDLITYLIRIELNRIKEEVKAGGSTPLHSEVLKRIKDQLIRFQAGKLKKVINATGIIVHTNLGRAPYSKEILNDTFELLNGYNNLEFDLRIASRGSRNIHASEQLKFLCGAEDVLVVNNNAAAVVLILRAFARGKEVVVSRGELIEIGGSFRLPDIIATADCNMVEVGTTNKTRVSDYEQAINKNTAVLFKAHTSNYSIKGFTQEASLKELVKLGNKYDIPVVYDMGSGLLNNQISEKLKHEPNVKETLQSGVDLVSFSGDKLLGGPQSGIIAGKKKLVQKLKKEPLLRALRVDKLTLAFLETNSRYCLNEKELNEKNAFYKILNQTPDKLHKKAEKLKKLMSVYGVNSEITQTQGQFGGGALPGKVISSMGVSIIFEHNSSRQQAELSENLYMSLLQQDVPVLGFLKKGQLYFDVLCVAEEEIEVIAKSTGAVYQYISS